MVIPKGQHLNNLSIDACLCWLALPFKIANSISHPFHKQSQFNFACLLQWQQGRQLLILEFLHRAISVLWIPLKNVQRWRNSNEGSSLEVAILVCCSCRTRAGVQFPALPRTEFGRLTWRGIIVSPLRGRGKDSARGLVK